MGIKRFLLYKVYYFTASGGDELVYIGRTYQSLNTALHGHFFRAPMMTALDINKVSRVESADVNTAADMYVLHIALVNRYKPALNQNGKTKDELTISLPDVPFSPAECPYLERWKDEICQWKSTQKDIKNEKKKLFQEHRNKRREIFSNKEISADVKAGQWTKWLVEYYEPALEQLKNKEESEIWHH